MSKEQLIENIVYLINVYIPAREDLKTLIKKDIGAVKYILAEIDKNKEIEYSKNDLDLIQDIVYFFV